MNEAKTLQEKLANSRYQPTKAEMETGYDMPKPQIKPTIKVKPHSYQPGKAELEENITVRKSDGSLPTPRELVRAALRPMNVVDNPQQ